MPVLKRIARSARRVLALCAIAGFGRAASAQPSGEASATDSIAQLPVTEVPARRAGTELAIFLTGDGGFAELDKQVATVLADSGIAVVALDSRAYLWRRRTPAEIAADVARLARHYGVLWHRERFVLVGYSHGANLLPFLADQLPADIASHVSLLAMLGLGTGASFQFHFSDLFRDIHRSSDLPILPQLQKLRGQRMVCIYGVKEERSACRDADAALLQRHAVPGDHHFDRAYAAIGAAIATAARQPPNPGT
jgi:type IV secretory pathway VirJ component